MAAPLRRLRAEDSTVVARVLRLVGLGVRSRGVVVGLERVRESAKSGKLALAIVATDASHHSLEKVVPLLRGRRISFIEVPSAADLGSVAGRAQTAAVGVVNRQLANGVRDAVRRQAPGGAHEEGV
ncbi:MAG TPA: ribosomal L7Ae/L30e/S12e/Gadd45 family protein [Gemmatimonadaceae bacterium]|nr:ribosomal L7Ae/L30e/S12e/Gadd45 family protein [Gemmatimonadaceae bacterium]